jgi:ketosteroid isomerase-like protein
MKAKPIHLGCAKDGYSQKKSGRSQEVIAQGGLGMMIEEMEKRLKALEDLEEIKKLMREYVFLVNDHKLDQLVELYSKEEPVAELREDRGVRRGRKEIAEVYANIATSMPIDVGHLLAQPVITVNGDTAEGHWLMYGFLPDKKIQWLQTRFDAKYVREDGKWKIKWLKYTRPWPDTIHDYRLEP